MIVELPPTTCDTAGTFYFIKVSPPGLWATDKDLYCFSGSCTKFTDSCSARQILLASSRRMSRECKRGGTSSFLIGRLTVNPGPAGRDPYQSQHLFSRFRWAQWASSHRFGQLTRHSDIVTDSQWTENISLFHAYARKTNMWILNRLEIALVPGDRSGNAEILCYS